MDAIRNFFANFKKHGTISRTFDNRPRSLTNEVSVLAKEAKGRGTIDKQTDMDLTTNNKDFEVNEQQNERIPDSYSLNSFEIQQLDSQGLIKNIDTEKHPNNAKDATTACLKEFDEILGEINRDITEEYVSLDEIDDVLYKMAKEDNVTEPLKLEIPRFDLQDLLPFDLTTENHEVIEPYIDTIYDLNESYIKDPLDFDGDILNEITNEANVDTNDKTYDHYNEINRNLQNADVISISSEDSEAHETDLNTDRTHEPKEENNVNDEPKNVNNEYEAMTNEPKIINYIEGSDVKNLVLKDNSNNYGEIIVKEPKNVVINDEPKKVNNKSKETVKSMDVVFIDNDNKLKKRIYETENANDEPNVKNGDIVSIEDSNDDCGYRSSDFEFITEEEAKMDGLIVNFDLNSLKKKISKPKRVTTIEIAIDQFANPLKIEISQGNSLLNNFSWSEANNLDNVSTILRKSPEKNTARAITSGLQINCPRNVGSSLRYVRKHRPRIISRGPNFYKNTENCKQENKGFNPNVLQRYKDAENFVHKSGFVSIDDRNVQINYTEGNKSINFGEDMQENGSDMKFGSNKMEDDPEKNTFRLGDDSIKRNNRINTLQRDNIGINSFDPFPNHSHDNGPGFNNFNPRSNNLQENLADFNNFASKSNNSQENGLLFNNIGQHSLMQDSGLSNKRYCPEIYDSRIKTWRLHRNQNQFVPDHRVLIGEEYYRLFDPNFGPLPDQRLMENKSIMPTSTMFVEFDGVGFDMQMMRERNESDDDDVKVEADESARKILEMYPVENRKRRRF